MNVYLFVLLVIAFLGSIKVWRPRKETFITLIPALIVVFIAVSMILFPEPSFKAAERGLAIWWEVVLPALLPFFIAAELLMEIGIVHFVGVLMEPLMRPLFNVPGTGAFALAMGIASGYPLGAALSARLKTDDLATKTEAERLMCFCNTSDPLFMTGAVAVGMFKRTDVAGVIMLAHYLSALTVGLTLRFWRVHNKQSVPAKHTETGSMMKRGFEAMKRAQRESGKKFGEMMGGAVKRSLDTLLLVLGFIVLFSVIFEILTLAGAVGYFSRIVAKILPERLLPKTLHQSIVSGLFEITIGTSLASQAIAPLISKVAVCSGIIAWSGLSVHAQVAAVIQSAGLSIWPYSASRLLQSVLAGTYTFLLMRLNQHKWVLPAFEPAYETISWFHTLGISTKTCLTWVLVMIVTALAFSTAHSLRQFFSAPRYF